MAYAELVEDLGMTFQLANIASALNFTGLALGSICFIPLTYRYGRRPIYLISVVLQLASAIWMARVRSTGEYLGCTTLMGLGGAISETIVQMTIVDLFFVHQYATMNGLFIFMQGVGANLGPVAAGYVVASQGWRWMWWWTAIFLGVALLMVLGLFEETVFIRLDVPEVVSHDPSSDASEEPYVEDADIQKDPQQSSKLELQLKQAESSQAVNSTPVEFKPLRARLALVTKSDVSIKHRFISPFIILVSFPAVAYAALTYGTVMAILSMIITFASTQMLYPPYNFTSIGIGLINIAPFVGQMLGTLVVAPMSDAWIIRQARRNGGIYEPEMRLWLALLSTPFVCAGTLMFGIGLARVRSTIVTVAAAEVILMLQSRRVNLGCLSSLAWASFPSGSAWPLIFHWHTSQTRTRKYVLCPGRASLPN